MHTRTGALLVLPALFLIGCGATAPEPVPDREDITNRSGRIQMLREGAYAIDDQAEQGTRYAPSNLPDEFKKHGARVIFSGRVGEIPPHVRLWGIPLELTDIRLDFR